MESILNSLWGPAAKAPSRLVKFSGLEPEAIVFVLHAMEGAVPSPMEHAGIRHLVDVALHHPQPKEALRVSMLHYGCDDPKIRRFMNGARRRDIEMLMDAVSPSKAELIYAIWYDTMSCDKLSTIEFAAQGKSIFISSLLSHIKTCDTFSTEVKKNMKPIKVVGSNFVQIGEVRGTEFIVGDYAIIPSRDPGFASALGKFSDAVARCKDIFARDMMDKEFDAMEWIDVTFNSKEPDRRTLGRMVEPGVGGMCKPTTILIGRRCGMPTVEWKGSTPPVFCACQSTTCGEYVPVNITDKIPYANLSRTMEYLKDIARHRFYHGDAQELQQKAIKLKYHADMARFASGI